MSGYDIAQLVISILSLVATIAISVILYKLDRKRDKEIEIQKEKARQKDLEHEAELFLIKNGDEIQYLPLCVIANNLNCLKKHKRDIYNNFNICSDEVKEIILDKQKIALKKVTSEDWFEICNSKFVEAIKEFKLGRNMYYDNAKYVRYCYDYYGKEPISFDTSFKIQFMDYNITENTMVPWVTRRASYYSYVNHYFHFLDDLQKYENPHNIKWPLPCDFLYNKVVNEDENIYCYWSAEQMRCLCSFIRERNYEHSLYRTSYSQAIEISPEYFEDMYYCALYELYITFGKEFER